MWLSHKNSINPAPTSPRRSNFNRHSFKNIDDILVEDDKTSSTTTADHSKPKKKPSSTVSSSPATPDQSKPRRKKLSPVSSPPAAARQRQSAFHRACLTNQATRTIASTRSKPINKRPNKAHDSIAPAIKIHEKPNKAHDSIAHEKTNHARDSIREKPIKIVSSFKIHEKHKKTHDSIARANEKPREAHDSITQEKPNVRTVPLINIPNSENRVVVYMTSLGAVRPTFDACRAVRSILQGFRVPVDERDLSMDSSFKEELHQIMLQTQINKDVGLPRVFIGGRYVGDADDVRMLSETGELKKLLEGLPAVPRGVCSSCGDFRFVICSDCNGSRKCYREKGFRSCMVCNKNGLIRCPHCWTVKC